MGLFLTKTPEHRDLIGSKIIGMRVDRRGRRTFVWISHETFHLSLDIAKNELETSKIHWILCHADDVFMPNGFKTSSLFHCFLILILNSAQQFEGKRSDDPTCYMER